MLCIIAGRVSYLREVTSRGNRVFASCLVKDTALSDQPLAGELSGWFSADMCTLGNRPHQRLNCDATYKALAEVYWPTWWSRIDWCSFAGHHSFAKYWKIRRSLFSSLSFVYRRLVYEPENTSHTHRPTNTPSDPKLHQPKPNRTGSCRRARNKSPEQNFPCVLSQEQAALVLGRDLADVTYSSSSSSSSSSTSPLDGRCRDGDVDALEESKGEGETGRGHGSQEEEKVQQYLYLGWHKDDHAILYPNT